MKKNSFLKNVLVLLFSQGIIKLIGIIYKLYLTNKTGYADTGNALFAAAFQVYAIFLTICSIGVPNAISSLTSARFAIGDNKGAYRILKVAISVFGFIGFLASTIMFFLAHNISSFYLEMPETEIIIKTLAPSVFIVAVTSVFKGYFNGKQRINITANSLTIEQIIKTIFTIVLVETMARISNNNTIVMVCTVGATITIGNVMGLLYIYINYLKSRQEIWSDIITSTKNKQERLLTLTKKIFKVSFPIALCALLGTINKTIDALTIVRFTKEYLGEAEAIKQYGILSGKIESLIVFPLSFNMAITTALIPKVSESNANGKIDDTKKILKFALTAGILIGIPCFLVMFCFPKEILTVLFPKASEGNIMLRYSSITIIVLMIIQTINSYFQGINKMGIQILAVSIGTVLKLLLNIVLLQNNSIGIYGAIISNIISYTTILVILIIYLIGKEKIKFEIVTFFIKPVILISCMYIIIERIFKIGMVKNMELNLLISLIAAGIIYVGLIIIMKIISKKDVQMMTKR